MDNNEIVFHFISEPTDVNFGGKVHGGTVMKWIDQTAYTCACNWAESYCVTVYVGGIRFYRPVNIGEQIRIESKIIHTGNTSMHIAVDVYSKKIAGEKFIKKTHCVVVFVSVNENGKSQSVKKWIPTTEKQIQMQKYALKLKELRLGIEDEMKEFMG